MSKKRNVRINVDKAWMESLQTQMQACDDVETMREAFTILAWAVQEIESGRVIMSVDPNRDNVRKVRTKGLDSVSRQNPSP